MSLRTIFIVLAIIACGAGATIPVVAMQAGGRSASDEYRKQVQDIIVRHNTISGRWNEFLDDFNAAEVDPIPEFYERFGRAADLTSRLAVDSQSVIAEWKVIESPPDYEEAHRLALRALRTTQDAFLAFDEYFRRTVEEGFPPEELRHEGRAKLEEVASLWEEVRAASP